MQCNKNIPELRFPEFEGEWITYKLCDVVTRIIRKNKNLETKRPLTISAKYGLIDQIEFFDKYVASKNLKGYYLLKKGEFAYNKSYSNGFPYGAVKRLDLYNQGAISTLYICFEITNKINSNFLKIYFDSNKWNKEMYKIAVEGARNHGLLNIPINDFFNTKHLFPSISEQEKIADFLSAIDKKIGFMEKKHTLYQNIKKYYSHVLFSNTSDWNKKNLKDIAIIKMGFTPSTKKEEYWNGNIKWLAVSDMGSKYISKTKKHITKIAIGKKEIIKKDTLVMSFKLTIGKLGILKEDMYSNEAICNFQWKNKNINTEFMYYYLSSINLKKYGSQAAKGITLNKETLNMIPIRIPSYETQINIVNILSNIDIKLEYLSKKINYEKRYKKDLLQKMFV
ncbi:restriction endonuclease subunit S [Methanosphaera stadtmanae]|uniref:Predicted type I restriction-modification system subunit n=1 Tax=Methanosphaera stadtmanae (strain ATCC 43021 / DSM 3091 / JCM 11832 / MCB-3) TaxID=339860 RepID=Q2NH19_METST|nr:restriction endonuclease subunit S [Methanosphaera stadtmanae]ABC56884.1 predicted type I restriction-modification system subunit [Methanosphaera stadtmanae DSM 3091]